MEPNTAPSVCWRILDKLVIIMSFTSPWNRLCPGGQIPDQSEPCQVPWEIWKFTRLFVYVHGTPWKKYFGCTVNGIWPVCTDPAFSKHLKFCIRLCLATWLPCSILGLFFFVLFSILLQLFWESRDVLEQGLNKTLQWELLSCCYAGKGSLWWHIPAAFPMLQYRVWCRLVNGAVLLSLLKQIP